MAVAAALGAEVCEIYTDVAGVYSADPRIVPDARKLETVSFEEMLEMAASGAGVLQLRSVEYARNHGVRIHCRSSFDEQPGTFVVAEGETMEQPLITAVTHSTSEARVTLTGVPDAPGAAARIFEALAQANVNVDMIVQNEPVSAGGQAEISFTVPREDLRVARAALEPLTGEAFAEMTTHEEMGKVSIVGAGMRSHPGVAAKVFGVLAERGREHRHDLHLADQDLVRDRPRPRRAGRAGAAQRVRALRRGHRRGRGAVRDTRAARSSRARKARAIALSARIAAQLATADIGRERDRDAHTSNDHATTSPATGCCWRARCSATAPSRDAYVLRVRRAADGARCCASERRHGRASTASSVAVTRGRRLSARRRLAASGASAAVERVLQRLEHAHDAQAAAAVRARRRAGADALHEVLALDAQRLDVGDARREGVA